MDSIRRQVLKDGRPLKVLQTDNGKEFQNAAINSSYHSSIKKIPERLDIFDEVDLIRDIIKHNLKISNDSIKKGDFVRLLNKRAAFEKEGQKFTG